MVRAITIGWLVDSVIWVQKSQNRIAVSISSNKTEQRNILRLQCFKAQTGRVFYGSVSDALERVRRPVLSVLRGNRPMCSVGEGSRMSLQRSSFFLPRLTASHDILKRLQLHHGCGCGIGFEFTKATQEFLIWSKATKDEHIAHKNIKCEQPDLETRPGRRVSIITSLKETETGNFLQIHCPSPTCPCCVEHCKYVSVRKCQMNLVHKSYGNSASFQPVSSW